MEIKIYNVRELTDHEQTEVNGGELPSWLVKLGNVAGRTFKVLGGIGVVIYVIDNWESVEEGWSDGVAAASN